VQAVPFTNIFKRRRRPVLSLLSGRQIWPNTTRWKTSSGSGSPIDGAYLKAPMGKDEIGPNPTDRREKTGQRAIFSWKSVVPPTSGPEERRSKRKTKTKIPNTSLADESLKSLIHGSTASKN
jgi:hypothetical protein